MYALYGDCVMISNSKNVVWLGCRWGGGGYTHWHFYSNVLWASKNTYHLFRGTLTKIHHIKINNFWTLISYSILWSTSEKQKWCFCQQQERAAKCGEIAKCHFLKITETANLEHPRKATYFRTFNSYLFNFNDRFNCCTQIFVRAELCARKPSSYCDFWKMTSCDFTAFYTFLTLANFCFLRCTW